MAKTSLQDVVEAEVQATTKERIKAVAGELYVLRGHDGFSFADIAEATGMTRANIHHHFGSKNRLISELITDFADDAQTRIERLWAQRGLRFSDRMSKQIDEFNLFFQKFNKTSNERNVWSPLSRVRHDLQILGEPAMRALDGVNRTYEVSLRQALAEAIERGELVPHTPVDDLVRVLRVTLLSCPPMTQDTGSFREIQLLLEALSRSILAAWGPTIRPDPDVSLA
jgi:AcrR family transcriptional regulator